MGDLSSGGVLKIGRERSSQLLRPRPLTVSMSRSQLFLGRLHSCIACLRFASRLHFGTSGCNCKHVPHRKGDWQGFRFALRRSASALPVATTQERRKRSYNKYREFWLSLTGRSLDARQHRLCQLSKLVGSDVTEAICNLFRAGNPQTLPLLDRLDKKTRVEKRLMCTGVQPGRAPAHHRHLQGASFQIQPVQVGYLTFSTRGRTQRCI